MERLTLEEAICRVRGVAKKQRWNSKYTKVSLMNEELNKRHKADCIKDAEEHEQLAEWLEELKSYKDIGTPKELKELKENGAFTGLELAKLAIMQKELKKYKDLEERLHKIFGEESTFSLADVIDALEMKLSEPDKKHPVNARILTYEEANKWQEYKDLEEQGLLVRLTCKVGDTVYVDSAILPIEDMECYEDVDNKIPSYFQGRVVSFRFARRNWVKIAVKAKWLYEWIDDETGPESGYIECEKSFSIPLSIIGENIFLTREEAEKKLEEMKKK